MMNPNPDLEARLQRAESLIAGAAERDHARDERMDALTQSVELLAGMHRETEAGMQRLETSMVNLTDTMTRLANIVIRHEERLDSIDGGHD